MITKFKLFEDVNVGPGPSVDDYVICKQNSYPEYIKYFISNHIGQYDHYDYGDGYYIIKYDKYDLNELFIKYPESKQYFSHKYDDNLFRLWLYQNMIYWSKNKEDLEDVLAAKNFNL